jgi:hypothetical protein
MWHTGTSFCDYTENRGKRVQSYPLTRFTALIFDNARHIGPGTELSRYKFEDNWLVYSYGMDWSLRQKKKKNDQIGYSTIKVWLDSGKFVKKLDSRKFIKKLDS